MKRTVLHGASSAPTSTQVFKQSLQVIDYPEYSMGAHLGPFDAHSMGSIVTMNGKSFRFEIDEMNQQGTIELKPQEIENIPCCSLTTALEGLSPRRAVILLAAAKSIWIGVRVSIAGINVVSNLHP